MRKLLLTSALFATVLPGFSLAADLITASPAPFAPPPAPIWDVWSGFSMGIVSGYGWGNTASDSYRTYPSYVFDNHVSFERRGGFVGLETGYNWMVAPNWLIGAEGDVSAASIDGSLDACTASGCSHTDARLRMLSTLRGRIGYVWNNVLLYGTGGGAFVATENTRTITSVTSPSREDLVGQLANSTAGAAGWTAGGGFEYAVAPDLSAKVEYLFVDYDDTHTYLFSDPFGNRRATSESKLDVVRAGLNYRFNATYAPLK